MNTLGREFLMNYNVFYAKQANLCYEKEVTISCYSEYDITFLTVSLTWKRGWEKGIGDFFFVSEYSCVTCSNKRFIAFS